MQIKPFTTSPAIYPATDPEFISFPSRRSVVHGTNGMVACTQPLAARAGLRILREGGNAADAAVAVAAALNVTEPTSTGIGGDMFALFYSAKSKIIRGLNGSGRAASDITLDGIREELGLEPGQLGRIPMNSVHAVTTPGAAAGWVDMVDKFGSGKLSLEQVLMPAIELAEQGYPVAELSSEMWRAEEHVLREASPNFGEILKPDIHTEGGRRAPRAGEIFQNANLAKTFRLLGKHGRKGFYEGDVAAELIKVVQARGGHLSLSDLTNHGEKGSDVVEPISIRFNGQAVGNVSRDSTNGGQDTAKKGDEGVDVWECPPNGQGIVALMALGILEELERSGKIPRFEEHEHNSAEHLHAVIESLRIAFADAHWFVADPSFESIPTEELLSNGYLAERAKLFMPGRANPDIDHGSPAHNLSDTVYFAVTDGEGNGTSFINSNFGGFGSGIVPRGCGFTLHNRGASFRLEPTHPNVLAPAKRPYHTIIPAMVTNADDQSLNTIFGVMGGYMQPQGHVQVLLNMLAFRQTPQAALDAPRVCIGAGMPPLNEEQQQQSQGPKGQAIGHYAPFLNDALINLEEGISPSVAAQLREWGHQVRFVTGWGRGLFGRGQVIKLHTDPDTGIIIHSAGSDPRGDGAAVPA
ncbi:MAG: hypothetical protein M1838_004164 [Thelocarpon superellum]|nr:MAG: hypothetical protein M1838_004164 [Thelocarpon superellum]